MNLKEDRGGGLTRSLTLTAEGEAFVRFAKAMADAESGARVELRPLPEKTSRVLRMTAPTGFRQSVAPPMLASLLEANPELRIDLDLPIIRLVSSDRGSTQPCGSRRWAGNTALVQIDLEDAATQDLSV